MLDLSSIQNSAILRGLEQSHLGPLATIACERECQEGERLFTRGELADVFYVAKRGHFALTLQVRVFDERNEFVVEEKGALDAFGWSALVAPHTSISSAYCTFDGAVVTFPGDELRQLISTNDSLGRRLSSNLNILIGARVRAVQDLWVRELERSRVRIKYWTQTELSSGLRRAVKKRSASHSVPHGA